MTSRHAPPPPEWTPALTAGDRSGLDPTGRIAIVNSPEGRAHALVARYYNIITPVLMSSARRRAGVMHQELWAPGVASRDEALQYTTGLVEAAISPVLARAKARPTVLDLGCGVGGAAARIARRNDVRVIGLTLSIVQARSMRKRLARSGVGATCHVVVADYNQPPVEPGVAAAYALESFTHALDPALFLERIAAQLAPAGRLAIYDDFIAASPPDAPPERDCLIDKFRRGWLLHSLMTRAELVALASASGFTLIEERDLSACVPKVSLSGRLFLRLGARFLPPDSLFGAISGGAALRLCQERGWLEKRFLVFGRST